MGMGGKRKENREKNGVSEGGILYMCTGDRGHGMKNPRCCGTVGNANPMKFWAVPLCLKSPNLFGLRELAVVPRPGASDIVGAGRTITHEKISSTVVCRCSDVCAGCRDRCQRQYRTGDLC
jgi:hypothetical protein